MSQQVLEGYRLSRQQRRWLELYEQGERLRVCGRIRVSGEVELDQLARALEQTVQRHEALRTSFHALPGMELPLQVIGNACGYELEREAGSQSFVEWCAAEQSRAGTGLRVVAKEQELWVSVAALCSDARGLENLVQEVSRRYGGSDERGEVTQYADYAEWQSELLADGASVASRAGGELLLPLERAGSPSEARERERLELSAELLQRLEAAGEASGHSVEELLLGSWYLLLWRLSGAAEVTVEVELGGRKFAEMAEAIGCYAQPVPVRLEMAADYQVSELLELLSAQRRRAEARQEYYDWVQDYGSYAAAATKVGFSYREQRGVWRAGELEWKWEEVQRPAEAWKLELRCERVSSGVRVEVWYAGERYEREEMKWLAQRYGRVVEAVASGASVAAAAVGLLSAAEREQQVVAWNRTARAYEREQSIQQLFEAQAARRPEAVAVVYEEAEVTYTELNARANQLAHQLRALGVGPEVLVGICVERSVEMIVGLLGILKAGGAYLPLDPSYPRPRLEYMLEDAGATVLLTQRHLLPLFAAASLQVVCVDEETQERWSTENPASVSAPENLCYVIYTSGSTGEPKGVQITQGNVLNLRTVLQHAIYGADSEPLRVSLNASLSFDSSVKQLIQLLDGHSLHVLSETVRRDAEQLHDYIVKQQLTVLDCTPAQLRAFSAVRSEAQPWVRMCLVGGEAIDEGLWEQLAADEQCVYYNVYGPTECTVDAAVSRVRGGERVNIGRAVANTELYVVDERGAIAPIGTVGELYIGGAGVGRGYLRRPELTAAKFIPDPFSGRERARLYRTGDLVRYSSAGQLEFVGRVDEQVKVRGYRIELGEIEATLRRHEAIKECAVVARVDQSGGQRLIGYLVAGQRAEWTELKAELREYLEQRLPEHMIPATWVELAELPLSRNGKVDRRALPEPETLVGDDGYVAPGTALEELLASIWGEVLKVERVGRHDDFFELGGHSLLATQVVSRVREVCGAEAGLRLLFQSSKLNEYAAGVAETLRGDAGLTTTPLRRVDREQPLPLSFAQQRLWFINQMEPANAAYNIPAALSLSGELNRDALEQTLDEILRRHEVLRTSFSMMDGEPVQVIAPATEVTLPLLDLSALAPEERAAEVRQLAAAEARRAFDLSTGPMLRAQLLRLAETEHVLLCTMHHIVSDGWSLGLLVNEVATLYRAFAAGDPSPLPELTIQYADFAAWQREWLTGAVLDQQLAYWKQQLQDAPAMLELPTDRPRPFVRTYHGARHNFRLTEDLSVGLKELARREGATLFMVLLAGFDVLLSRYSGQEDIVVGTDIANRNRAETEQLIGFFVNQLVLRTDVSGNPSYREVLRRVREVALGAYAHQDIPFEKLVEELQPERDLSRSPLFQVKFVMQNAPRGTLELADLKLSNTGRESETATFDLLLTMFESKDGLMGFWSYSTDIFDESTIARMSQHFVELLRAFVTDAQQRVGTIPLLSETEQQQILVDWNQTAHQYPHDKSLAALFENHVAQNPAAVALVHEEAQISYGVLNARANRLARHLRALGVGPEVFVGICLARPPDVVLALLAVLKTGGAYLPIDAKLPLERVEFMLQDAMVPVLLTEEKLVDQLPVHWGHTVCLDTDAPTIDLESDANLNVEVSPDNAAYVIYTSGSTGTPKGVVIAQSSVANLATWQADCFNVTRESRIAQCFSYSFDGAVGETFMALLNGATLVHLDLGNLTPDKLVDEINRHGISLGVFVPSLLAQLNPERLSHPDLTVISVGEACPNELALRWSRHHKFVNAYGPTEYTVYSHLWKVDQELVGDTSAVPIGTPIHNTRTYILDRRLYPVPIGVPGEIYISGAGLARGYLNRPELTAERFIPNPFAPAEETREYGPQLIDTALAEIERFEAGRGKAIAAHAQHNGNGKGYLGHVSVEDVLKLAESLGPELYEQTCRFVNGYNGDDIGFAGFCRYLFEGANNSYAAEGITEEVLRMLLPFESFDGLKGLDFCFGNAEVMQTLSRMGACMKGLDLSPFFVQRAEAAGLDAQMAKVDLPVEEFAREYGIDEGSYDFALTTLSLDRVERPRNFLENLFFTIKDNGCFAIQTLMPVVPIDDGDIENPIVYTLEQDRITPGEDVETDQGSIISLLSELGASYVNICQLPYVVASRDGVQKYEVWSFFGRRQARGCAVAYGTLYRTGDLGCYLPGGEIKYLGRIDDQVKLRGFRVELAEIETVLRQHPQVKECVVVLTQGDGGDKRLAAYLVAAGDVTLDSVALRTYLREKLPDYMIPSFFVMLEELPVTASGKIDRRALPAPRLLDTEDALIEPRTANEELLAGMWCELLGNKRMGVHTNFFDAGGHSLLATQLISRIREVFGVDVSLRGLFEMPTIAGLASQIEAAQRTGEGSEIPAIVSIERNGELPLSFAQQRLWFIDRLEPDKPLYNVPTGVRLKGALDVAALERTLSEIVRRHEVLRTSFAMIDGEPVQVIAPFLPITIPIIDTNDEAEAQRLAAEEARRPFDLSTGPMLRAQLLRLPDEEHVLLCTMHHIVSDAWSRAVLIKEVAALYQAFANGEPSPLPELTIQYADFAAWQREWLTGAVLDQQLAYWKQQLQDAPAMLELPTDRPRPLVRSYRGARHHFRLSEELSANLKELARREGATLFMVLLAAFDVLLARYSGQEDIVVGTDIANRNRAETEQLIGFFVNQLVLRTDVSGDPSYREVLRRVREASLGAYAHQDIPFEKLVEELQPERDLSRSPLFQVKFVMQNAPSVGLQLPGLELRALPAGSDTTQLDLTLLVSESGSGELQGTWAYSTELFEAAAIAGMAAHFENLLAEVVAAPDRPVSTVKLLSEAERRQLLVEWNETTVDYSSATAVQQLFEREVEQSPGAAALVAGAEQLTYAELNARANQLAHHLRQLGVGPEVLVGICMERSLELVVSVLGVLKAGGAYLPLDAKAPLERLSWMLEDAGVAVLLTQERLAERLPAHTGQTIYVDSEWAAIAAASRDNPVCVSEPSDLCYVIYTSGSTGKPKGVAIEQRGLLNYLRWSRAAYEYAVGGWTPLHSSLSFDLAVTSLYVPLVSGGTVELLSEEVEALGAALASGREYELVKVTPGHLQLLNWSVSGAQVKTLVVGGEQLLAETVWPWLSGRTRVFNEYGPTETVVGSVVYEAVLADERSGAVAIGRPIGNTAVYVLDDAQEPVPVGVVGELYIGGAGVARGYLNRPELTAQKFVMDPFTTKAGARLYRTGDLVRWRRDGKMEFLGRVDEQVKVRGYRVELGEIEATLKQHPTVKECVVVATAQEHGDKRLVAYVVAMEGSEWQQRELREYLQQRLPEYMIPTAWVELAELPLTRNGKVDRRALPAPEMQESVAAEHEAPHAGVEELIASVWSQVLQREQVRRQDHFFELGGHSLLATQVISRIQELCGVELPLRTLFEGLTLSEFSARVEEQMRAGVGLAAPPLMRTSREQPLPLSFAQQRLWFIDQLEPGASLYNVPLGVRLSGELNLAALEQTLSEIVRRHEVLRTSFSMIDGEPVQVIAPFEPITIPITDLSSMAAEEREAEARRLTDEEACQPFDLSTGPMLRAQLLRLAETEHVLLCTMHHIVSDGWSMGLLVKEVTTLYRAFAAGKPSPLPELTIQYADFAAWRRSWLTGSVLDQQLSYWKQQLHGTPAMLKLPTDRPRPAIRNHHGARHHFRLSEHLSAGLKELARREGATLFMVLLAAFDVLLSRYSGQEDIVVGTDIANRNRAETEQMIGFFVNQLVLRTDVSGNPSYREVLRRVREVTLGAYAHQDIPFEKLVEELQPERDLSRSPLFQVSFVLQNMRPHALQLPGLEVTLLSTESQLVKFDLTLMIMDQANELSGTWSYCTELFDEQTIAKMQGHFEALLAGIVRHPETRVNKFDLRTDHEKHQATLRELESADLQYRAFTSAKPKPVRVSVASSHR